VSKTSVFFKRGCGQCILGEKLSGNHLNEAALAHPGRFKVVADNLHIIDKAKVKQDERLDGKHLLSTSDRHLSAQDIALGDKQLPEVERAFRILKGSLFPSGEPLLHKAFDRWRNRIARMEMFERQMICVQMINP
jgi:hypothetical protein